MNDDIQLDFVTWFSSLASASSISSSSNATNVWFISNNLEPSMYQFHTEKQSIVFHYWFQQFIIIPEIFLSSQNKLLCGCEIWSREYLYNWLDYNLFFFRLTQSYLFTNVVDHSYALVKIQIWQENEKNYQLDVAVKETECNRALLSDRLTAKKSNPWTSLQCAKASSGISKVCSQNKHLGSASYLSSLSQSSQSSSSGIGKMTVRNE